MTHDTPQRDVMKALSGGIPSRVPYIPKIWVDLAAKLVGVELRSVVEDPWTALSVIPAAAESIGADAARQFHFPRRTIAGTGDQILDVDDRGTRLGVVDMNGGLQTHLDSAETFVLEDEHYGAFHHYYSAAEPFIRSAQDVKRVRVPSKHYYEQLGCAERQRRMAEKIGGRIALIGDCSSATMAFLVTMRGMSRALIDLVDDPAMVHAIMEKGVAIAVEKGKFSIDCGLSILRLNDSVGNMSVISPAHWREFVFPHMKDVCDELHRYAPGVKIYCHICGDILPIVEDLVEVGLDCIAPLDPLGGSSCSEVRAAVPPRFPLMGGVNTLSFIDADVAEIRSEARRCIVGAGSEGAFILGSGCVVPRSARRGNLVAAGTVAHDSRYENGRIAPPAIEPPQR